MKYEDQAYVLSSNEDVEMRDVEDDEDDEEAVAGELGKVPILNRHGRHLTVLSRQK